MPLGFGSNRKAARLEVEVAGNLEQFDKDMEKVKREAKEAAESVGQDMTAMGKAVEIALGALTLAIVAKVTRPIARSMVRTGFAIQKVVGPSVTRGFATLAQSIGTVASRASARLVPALLAAVGAASKLGSRVGGTLAAGFRIAGTQMAPAVKILSVAFKGFTKFAVLLRTKVGRAVTGFALAVEKKLAGAIGFAAVGTELLGTGLRKLGNRLKLEGKILGAFGTAMHAVGTATEKTGRLLGKIIGVLIKMRIGTTLLTTAMLGLAAKTRGEFENAFARVRTLMIDLTDGEIVELRDQLALMRRELGITSDELNNTFYQTLSAMPELVNDAAGSLEILNVATKVATTGFADGETAIRAITGIMNAWKLETDEAIDVADALFAAQNQGVTTFGEIAESIGSVTGLTSALGGEWRDLLAIVATVSPFISTGEVLTGISSVLAGVLEASPAALESARKIGLDFSTARIEAIGLLPFITEIIEKSNGNADIIAKLFGRKEASQLVITLAGNMDELASKTREVIDAAGTTEEVFEITEDTARRSGERLKESFNGLLDEMGTGLDRVVINTKDAVTTAINDLTTLFESAGNLLDDLLAKSQGAGGDLGDELLGTARPQLDELLANRLAQSRRNLREGITRRGFQPEQPFGLGGSLNAILTNPALQKKLREELGLEPKTRFGGIVSPDDPASLEDSRNIINDMAASLDAVNKIQLQLTGDTEAYEIATRSAQEQINRLVLSERQRLIAAGRPLDEVNELMTLYAVLTDEAAVAQERAAESAAESLDSMLFGLGQLRDLGIEAFAEQRPEISALSSEYSQLGAELVQLAGVLEELGAGDTERREAALARIAAINDRRDALADQLDVFREMEPIIKAVGIDLVNLGQKLPADKIDVFNAGLADFLAGLTELQTAQAEYDNAVGEFGEGSEEAKEKQEGLTDAQKKFAVVMRQVRVLLKAAGLDAVALAKAMKTLEDAAGGDGLDPNKKGGFFNWMAENAGTIEGVARGLLSVGSALDIIGDSAKAALQGVIDISEGITRIASGDLIGGITQGVGGLIGIVGGLFGDSAADKERKKVIAANTQALKALKSSIDAQREIIGGAEGQLLGKLEGLFEGLDFKSAGGFAGLADLFKDLGQLKGRMDELGLSFRDLEGLLAELGIDIKLINDETGEPILQALKQAAAALRQLEIADFFAGFEGSLERLRREFEIMDIDDASDQLVRYVDLLKEFSGIEVPDFDLTTPEGRANLERFIEELFAGADQLTTDQLKNLNIAELLDLLGSIEGLIDTVDGGPDAESFQEFKGITEVTANRLAGLLTTDVYWNEITAQNVRAIVSLLGGTPIGAVGSDPVPNFDPSRFPGPDIAREPVGTIDQSVDIENINVEVVQANPDMDEVELGAQVAAAIDTSLGNTLRRQVRDSGIVTVRTAR